MTKSDEADTATGLTASADAMQLSQRIGIVTQWETMILQISSAAHDALGANISEIARRTLLAKIAYVLQPYVAMAHAKTNHIAAQRFQDQDFPACHDHSGSAGLAPLLMQAAKDGVRDPYPRDQLCYLEEMSKAIQDSFQMILHGLEATGDTQAPSDAKTGERKTGMNDLTVWFNVHLLAIKGIQGAGRWIETCVFLYRALQNLSHKDAEVAQLIERISASLSHHDDALEDTTDAYSEPLFGACLRLAKAQIDPDLPEAKRRPMAAIGAGTEHTDNAAKSGTAAAPRLFGDAASFKEQPSAWIPETDAINLAILGKLGEELGECSAIICRCIIQGVNEAQPVTHKPNLVATMEELADVEAGIQIFKQRFYNEDLHERSAKRIAKKLNHLKGWHELLNQIALADLAKAKDTSHVFAPAPWWKLSRWPVSGWRFWKP